MIIRGIAAFLAVQVLNIPIQAVSSVSCSTASPCRYCCSFPGRWPIYRRSQPVADHLAGTSVCDLSCADLYQFLSGKQCQQLFLSLLPDRPVGLRLCHLLCHQLTVIHGLVREDSSQLKMYIDSLLDTIPATPQVYCKNQAVNAIVSHYAALCQEQGMETAGYRFLRKRSRRNCALFLAI